MCVCLHACVCVHVCVRWLGGCIIYTDTYLLRISRVGEGSVNISRGLHTAAGSTRGHGLNSGVSHVDVQPSHRQLQ